jgi:hypothetical protein
MVNKRIGIIIGGIFLLCSFLFFIIGCTYRLDISKLQMHVTFNVIMLLISMVFMVLFLVFAFLLVSLKDNDYMIQFDNHKIKYGPFKDRY